MKRVMLKRIYGTRYLKKIQSLIKNARKKDREKKGRGNERFALQVAEKLESDQELPGLISKIYLTRPFSKLDKKGWDLVIVTDKGEIPIQIKSSIFYKKKFTKTHPGIITIVITEKVTEKKLRKVLKERIWSEYKTL